jgi:ADP-heptose:LPS heptosyltransferase
MTVHQRKKTETLFAMTAPRIGSLLQRIAPQSVVIFRALHLGDMLCWIPALRALRAALPEAHIALVGLPWAERFCQHYPVYLDEWIDFPGYPALEERPLQLHRVPGFIADLQSRQFDLAIQMHGNGLVANSLVTLFCADRTAGFFHEDAYIPDPEGFIPYPECQPEIWRHLRLMEHLGCTDLSPELEFPSDATLEELSTTLEQYHLGDGQPFICIHPGAKAGWRRWSVEAFAKVGDRLSSLGYNIVITGTENERPLARAIQSHMQWPAADLTGAFPDIGPLASLLTRASLLICGDTGVSHLACAVDCPSVVLFLRSELEGWPPLNRTLHRVVSHPTGVTPEMVLHEAWDLLQHPATPRPHTTAPTPITLTEA